MRPPFPAGSVPASPQPEITTAIAQFVLAAGYTQKRLSEIGLTKTPWRPSAERTLFSLRADEGSALGILIRVFFFGEALPDSTLSSLPSGILEDIQAAGMLEHLGDEWVPTCMLTHFENLLLACDSVRRVQAGVVEDLVLGVNRPTQILGHCMLPVPAGAAVLDLGTGCGPLALKAARTAGRVIATDVNPRALQFAGFNAALNGIANVEFRCGDRFEPVTGEQFDLIVSNPPFFITPKSKLLFTDNPFQLDLFAASLAQQAPKCLTENGHFQMLCEWVETTEDHARPRNWFVEPSCAVLILNDYSIEPAAYSASRLAEASALHGDATPASLSEYLRYFADNNVEKIHGGLVTLRKGQPQWFVSDEMGDRPTSSIGHLIAERFGSEDLISAGDLCLIACRPQLPQEVTLISESTPQNGSWKSSRIYLERPSSLPCRLSFSAEIADLLVHWDGSRSLAVLAATFAKQQGLPAEQVRQNFLSLARRLAAKNLIKLLQ